MSLGKTLRTRVAPLAFLLVIAMLGARTCEREATRVELRFDFGAHAADVQSFRVDVFRAGDDLSALVFERSDMSGVGSVVSADAQLDGGAYQLVFAIRTGDRTLRFERAIETADQAVITIPLERELAPIARPRAAASQPPSE